MDAYGFFLLRSRDLGWECRWKVCESGLQILGNETITLAYPIRVPGAQLMPFLRKLTAQLPFTIKKQNGKGIYGDDEYPSQIVEPPYSETFVFRPGVIKVAGS